MALINLEFPRTKSFSFKSAGALISTRELNVDVSETVNEFSSKVSPSTNNSLFNSVTPTTDRVPCNAVAPLTVNASDKSFLFEAEFKFKIVPPSTVSSPEIAVSPSIEMFSVRIASPRTTKLPATSTCCSKLEEPEIFKSPEAVIFLCAANGIYNKSCVANGAKLLPPVRSILTSKPLLFPFHSISLKLPIIGTPCPIIRLTKPFPSVLVNWVS